MRLDAAVQGAAGAARQVRQGRPGHRRRAGQRVRRAGAGHRRRDRQVLRDEIQRQVRHAVQGGRQGRGHHARCTSILTSKETDPKFGGEIKWNFTKFLISRKRRDRRPLRAEASSRPPARSSRRSKRNWEEVTGSGISPLSPWGRGVGVRGFLSELVPRYKENPSPRLLSPKGRGRNRVSPFQPSYPIQARSCMLAVEEARHPMTPTIDKRSLKPLQDVIARHWGYNDFRPVAGRGHAGRPRRPRFARRHADRRRQVALLPGPRRAPRRHHRRRLAAHRPDEGSGRRPARLRRRGRPDRQQLVTGSERAANEASLHRGEARLLFVSPERLVQTDFYRLLAATSACARSPSTRPIASATGAMIFVPNIASWPGCASSFPTPRCTPTPPRPPSRCASDICKQLGLQDPLVLVGNFDRPNLTYRVLPRQECCDRRSKSSTATRARRASSTA